MYEEALEEFQEEESISKGWNPLVECNRGVTYARMGKRDEAQQILDDMLDLSKKKYVSPQFIAILYFSLGEKDQGFEWLEKAYENHAYGLHLLKADPHFAMVRSDPRFEILLEKIGFKK
jgi:tetratricopeptide (TPR) repeat protein